MKHFHLETQLPLNIHGECDLILLSELPNDLSKFKSTFILVNNDPTQFFFINPKGEQEQVPVQNHDFFHRKLKEIINIKKSSVNLEIKLNEESKQPNSLEINQSFKKFSDELDSEFPKNKTGFEKINSQEDFLQFNQSFKEAVDELDRDLTSHQSLKIPLSLTPLQIKPLISGYSFPFSQIPTCLLAPILLHLNFLHIFAFAKTSKLIYGSVGKNKDLTSNKKMIEKIVGELPYLETIYPNLDFKPTFNFFDYARSLIQAFNIYSTTIDANKDKIDYRDARSKNLRAIFSRLLDLRNPGAAMHLLIKNMHPELLLTYRSYSGTNIAVEISKNLSKINLDIIQYDSESKTHTEVKSEIKVYGSPDRIKLFSDYLSSELEIKNSQNKDIKDQSLEIIQSSPQLLANRLFKKVIRISFPEYDTIMGGELFADRPSGMQIAKNIIQDMYRIICSTSNNPDIRNNARENTLHLFVISYACHQLKVIEIIQKKFLRLNGKFNSKEPILNTLAKYCIRYGQVELMNFLFSLPDAPSPDKIIANHVSGIIESQDIPMLKLLNLYKIKLANHNSSHSQVSAIRSLVFALNPYLTLEMMRGEVLLTSMEPDLRYTILLQFSSLNSDKINFLLTKWENELSNSDQPIELYKKNLFNFIVNLITHQHKNEDFIIGLIGNRISRNTVYKSDSPRHVYNNKALTQIVEEAKLNKVLSFLKKEVDSVSISSLPSTSFLLNRKRGLESSTSSFTPTNH